MRFQVYGTPDPTLTGTLTGFVPADNVTATYSRTAGETVTGSPYIISAALSPAAVLLNYNITMELRTFITANRSATGLTPSATTDVLRATSDLYGDRKAGHSTGTVLSDG